jgi:hypothetical protein
MGARSPANRTHVTPHSVPNTTIRTSANGVRTKRHTAYAIGNNKSAGEPKNRRLDQYYRQVLPQGERHELEFARYTERLAVYAIALALKLSEFFEKTRKAWDPGNGVS